MSLLQRAVRAYFAFCAGLIVRVRRPRIVGITGSAGKTTTKEVVAAVLSHDRARPIVGRVLKTPGNLNDNLGLPLAILGFTDWPGSRARLARWLLLAPLRALTAAAAGRYPDVLVLEYAASADGDVPRLARLAPPTVAVVTAIGPAHLEVFGTLERIAWAKGALVRAAPPDGLVVLGEENPFASRMTAESRAPVVRLRGAGRALSDSIARSIGAFFGVPDEAIEHALAEAGAVRRRLHRQQAPRVTLIDDTINANPLSMKLALATLAETAAPGQRKVALLGHMAELGPAASGYHTEIGAFARARADLVVGVGPLARQYDPHVWFEAPDDCVAGLPALLRDGDLVLVKGSASARMGQVAAAILRLPASRPAVPSASPLRSPVS